MKNYSLEFIFTQILLIMKEIQAKPIAINSKNFALRIIRFYNLMKSQRQEYVMSKQLLRNIISIGANVREVLHAQSKPDFIAKTNISFKKASELKILD